MKSNIELTLKEFEVSRSIKQAMNEIENNNIEAARIFLNSALRLLHRYG